MRTRLLMLVLVMAASFGGALVALRFAPAGSAQQSVADSVDAHQLRLLDSNGTVRGKMGFDNQGYAYICMTDREQLCQAGMSQTPDGSGYAVCVWSAGCKSVIGLLNGNPVVAVNDGTMDRSRMSLASDGSAALDLRDRNGQVRAQLKVGVDGTPELDFLDANGTVYQTYR